MAKKSFKEQAAEIREQKRRETVPTFAVDGKARTYNHYVATFDDRHKALDAIRETLATLDEIEVLAAMSNRQKVFFDRITSHDWALADQFNIGQTVDPVAFDRFIKRMTKYSKITVENDLAKPQPKSFSTRVSDIIAEIEPILDFQFFERIGKMAKPKDYMEKIIDIKSRYRPSNDVWQSVTSYYDKQRREVYDAMNGKIVEGYEAWKKVQLSAMYQVLSDIVGQKTMYSKVKAPKKQRTVTRKAQPTTKAAKQKAKEKLLATGSLIDGATAVILYTAKYKQVTVLFAEKGTKLSAKKKSINNIDLARSFYKRFSVNRHKLNSLAKMSFDKALTFIETTTQTKNQATSRIRDDYERISAIV